MDNIHTSPIALKCYCYTLYHETKSCFSFLFWYDVAFITMLSTHVVLLPQVPQHYKLMGYHPVSTWEAFNSYIPSTIARPLRTGPQVTYQMYPFSQCYIKILFIILSP